MSRFDCPLCFDPGDDIFKLVQHQHVALQRIPLPLDQADISFSDLDTGDAVGVAAAPGIKITGQDRFPGISKRMRSPVSMFDLYVSQLILDLLDSGLLLRLFSRFYVFQLILQPA